METRAIQVVSFLFNRKKKTVYLSCFNMFSFRLNNKSDELIRHYLGSYVFLHFKNLIDCVFDAWIDCDITFQ